MNDAEYEYRVKQRAKHEFKVRFRLFMIMILLASVLGVSISERMATHTTRIVINCEPTCEFEQPVTRVPNG